MKKPIILITPQNMPMEEPFRGNYTYSNCFNSDAIVEAGGLPVIPPFLRQEDADALMEWADGLLLSGGADVAPERYGAHKEKFCGTTEPQRDRSDEILLRAALRRHKPVLCICRGAQMANVFFGGTLYQDIPTQVGGTVHHSCYCEYMLETAHPVAVAEDTPLLHLAGQKELWVNSLHHQAIAQLAPCLQPMAFAPDGIVESWYLPDPGQWMRGYQWHPEMLRSSALKNAVFRDFLDACQTDR